MIAVVILSFTDNVLASRGIKSSNGRSFIILRSGEDSRITALTFLVKKKSSMKISGASITEYYSLVNQRHFGGKK